MMKLKGNLMNTLNTIPRLNATTWMIVVVLLVLAAFLAVAPQASAQATPSKVRVKATGQAPADLPNARETAIEDALRRCVEAGGGVQLASISGSEDLVLVADAIYARTAGYVQSYEVLKENPNQQGVYTVRVSGVVTTGDLNADAEAFKALLKRKGNPRVLIVGSASGAPLNELITTRLQGQLERMGMRVIDTEVLNEQQRKTAERAAHAELDPKKAALIAEQLGADILATVQVTTDLLPAQTVYGLTHQTVDAVGLVKLIRADTAEVLGSAIKEHRVTGDTIARTRRQATAEVTQDAMQQAVHRIAIHWLDEVDQREGQEILIVMHRFSFQRTTTLIEKLRNIDGVSSVMIDRTDAEATGQLRLTTLASAADIASVLTRLDSKMEITGSTANRIDVR